MKPTHAKHVEVSNSNTEPLKEPKSYLISGKSKKETTLITESKNDTNFFIGVTSGISKLNLNENNVIGNVPLNYAIEAGYNFNKNIFMTINYQRTDVEI